MSHTSDHQNPEPSDQGPHFYAQAIDGRRVEVMACLCGECQSEFFLPYCGSPREWEPSYCPYCGVKFTRLNRDPTGASPS